MDKMDGIDSYIEQYLSSLSNNMSIVSSEDYHNWLDTFIENHFCFSDDTWLYSQDEISKDDYKKVELLSTFFTYISNLAYEQNIFGTGNEYDLTFYFKMKGKNYRICNLMGQGSCTIISKMKDEEIKDDMIFIKLDEPLTEEEIKERELVQYIIINKDYIGKIDVAKFGVHIGHACTICAIEESDTEQFKRWYKNGESQKKIILTATTSQLEKLEKDFYSVRDLGLTEVEKGTLLAISLGILTRKEAKPFIKRMQLWK